MTILDRLPAFISALHIHRALSAETLRVYEREARAFAAWHADAVAADVPAAAVTRRDVMAYMEHCFYARHNSPRTRAKKLTALAQYFDWLAAEGYLDASPTAGIPSPRLPRPVPRRLTDRQLARLLGAWPGDAPMAVRNRALLWTLYAAGLRLGEAAALSLSDVIEGKGGFIYLTVHGKGAKQRAISMRGRAVHHLRAWLLLRRTYVTASDAVFLALRGDPRRLGWKRIYEVVKTSAVHAGIGRRVHPHILRSTCMTQLFESRLPPDRIAAFAGWESIDTGKHYNAIAASSVRATSLPGKRLRAIDMLVGAMAEGTDDEQ